VSLLHFHVLRKNTGFCFVSYSCIGFASPFFELTQEIPCALNAVPVLGMRLPTVETFVERVQNTLLYALHILLIELHMFNLYNPFLSAHIAQLETSFTSFTQPTRVPLLLFTNWFD
jgi:hypothetical protein